MLNIVRIDYNKKMSKKWLKIISTKPLKLSHLDYNLANRNYPKTLASFKIAFISEKKKIFF